MKKPPEPWKLAKEFCRILSDRLTPEQMKLVNLENEMSEVGGFTGICHSHDYCDANMVMRDACLLWQPENDEELMSEAWTNCWNKAWDMAKAADFNAHKINEREFLVKDRTGRGLYVVLPHTDILERWEASYKNDPDSEFDDTLGEWMESCEVVDVFTHQEDVCEFTRTA